MSQHLEPRRIFRLAGIALTLCLAGALVASCGNKQAAAPSDSGGKVLATVDGTKITQGDLDTAKSLLPIQYQDLPDTVLMPPLMDQLIDRRVAELAAEKAGLDKDPKVEAEIAQSREDVLQSAYLRQAAEKELTDGAVRDAYQQQIANFKPQEEVRARHILTKDEASIKLAAQRVADGEAFETVASEMSIDSSAEHGGDLGYFTRDKMVKAFSDVAFSLKPGEVSQPFQTQFGWHIVKVIDKRETQPPPFEAVEAQVRAQLADDLMQQKVASLRQGAKIERYDPWANVQPPVAAPGQDGAAPSADDQAAPAPASDSTPPPAAASSAPTAPPPATSPAPAPASSGGSSN